MLKVWIWKVYRDKTVCRVSPTEPKKVVDHEGVEGYSAYNDIVVCSKYIKRLTGRAPTLKPRAYGLMGGPWIEEMIDF